MQARRPRGITQSGRQMTSCRQRRRSVDIRKAAFAQTSQAFAFAGRRISRCRAAMTPEQEKALHDALDRLAGELATLKVMLRRLLRASNGSAMWRRAAQTCSCQASAEHFEQCAEFVPLRNRGLGPLAVTVLAIPLARRGTATVRAAVYSTASLFRR